MKTSNITTLDAIRKVQENAKHMPALRVADLKIGEVARQGDIYIERVAAIEGRGEVLKSRQLAPGTSKGSRHIVDESPEVLVVQSSPRTRNHQAFQVGPAIESTGPVCIMHPEHAWIRLLGVGKRFYQVFFQADWARKERARD